MQEGDWKFLWRMIGFMAMLAFCGGLLLPGTGGHPEATRRSEVVTNLKFIGLAYQAKANYDPYYRVPPVAIVDSNGQPLLSWRVLLLPLFDEQELFEQFDLTKLWDSPENLPLVEKMPDVFASPFAKQAAKQGKTPYKAITNDDEKWNTAWPRPGQDLKPTQFKDGISSTALVVEDLTNPVIWTKPEDITPGEYLQTLDHGQWSSKYFHLVFADGSVQSFKDPTEEEILPLMYANDGRVPEDSP